MSDDNVVKMPDPNTSSVADTKAVKMKKHVKKHKIKYMMASMVPLVIALLQAWPMLCPMMLSADRCAQTKPLAQFGEAKLQELKDAGI